jgi:hypothetical protein
MINDVYKIIDQVNPLNDIINNNNKYLYFFDSFIHNIKYNEKNDKIINKAKLILNNIDKRNLYTSIGDYYLSDNELVINQDQFENFNENTLVENINKSDGELKSTDIRIKKDIICLGSGNNDPFNNLLFYDNKFNTIKLKAEDVSKLVSNRYKHKIIRVFLTTKDKQKIKAAQNALINYKNKYKGNAYLYKSEQKIEKEEDNVKSFQLNEGIFKNNKKDNFNKDSRLGKKREIEKGYSMFHDQLFKKKK